jgi:hypothetical protein
MLRLIGGTSDVALLEAAGADVLLDGLAILEDGDALDVGLELADDGAVGVANRATSNSVLTADITYLRHYYDLQRAALSASNLSSAV